MEISPLTFAMILVTFFFAGVVKGVTGMGLPTVAMGVLGAVISPLAAAAMLLAPSLITNLWQGLAGPRLGGVVRRFWLMMIMIVLATLAGSALLVDGETRVTSAALGGALIVYSLYALVGPPFHVGGRLEAWFSPIAGGLTGAVTGATGIFVIPAVPYLQALGLEKEELVQALGLSFTVSTVAIAIALAMRHALPATELGISALATLPALVGMGVGQTVRSRISPTLFRRGFLIFLLVLGCDMVRRSL